MGKEKWVYTIMGFMGGAILFLLLSRAPVQYTIAESGGVNLGCANGMVAQTIGTPLQETILWVLDTAEKKVLVYEYDKSRRIVFKAFRDMQYDLTFPDGGAGIVTEPLDNKNLGLPGLDIKKWFENWIKSIDREKKEREKEK
ncbi:MAG: hypothetical protein HY811_02345 [Planctomycetes bacterium]|nr:hypothetical protein [Planctomycetota bacterium]